MLYNPTTTKGTILNVRSLCDRQPAGSRYSHWLRHCRGGDRRLGVLGRRLAPLAAVMLLLTPASAQAYCANPPCRCYMSPHIGKMICTDDYGNHPRSIPPEWRREREFGPWKRHDRPRDFWPPAPVPYWPR
jgi:hypothetical protein